MPDYLPKFRPGTAVTFTASAAVTGGRLVSLTGPRAVGPSGNDFAAVIGVAATDARAGDEVTVYLRGAGVHTLVANAAINTGMKIISGPDGKAAPIGAGVNVIGLALTTAAAANDPIDVLFI